MSPKKAQRSRGSNGSIGSDDTSPRKRQRKKKKKKTNEKPVLTDRTTSKGGGIPRESHRVNVIPTQNWDLYGTGASASHRAAAHDAKASAAELGKEGRVRPTPEKEGAQPAGFGARMFAPNQHAMHKGRH